MFRYPNRDPQKTQFRSSEDPNPKSLHGFCVLPPLSLNLDALGGALLVAAS